MFKRERHQKILKVLSRMNRSILDDARCFFGGGTAISMLLGEYRESTDIDLMVSSVDGYRNLRRIINEKTFGGLFDRDDIIAPGQIIRTDQYGIRAILMIDNTPIKFEIVFDGHLDLAGIDSTDIPIKVLRPDCLLTHKLMANADRWADAATRHRDFIDLAMMHEPWNESLPRAECEAHRHYGRGIDDALRRCADHLSQRPDILRADICALKMDSASARPAIESFMTWCMARPPQDLCGPKPNRERG